MSDQHSGFLQRLRSSWPAVFAVAVDQYLKGRSVEIAATRFAPTASEAERFVDQGDLIVTDHEAQACYRYEVKGLKVEFTSPADWPFREVFVSNVASVNRAGDAAAAYISVNAKHTHCAIIQRKTKPHWYVVERLVKNTGNVERNYACPLNLVTFEELAPYTQREECDDSSARADRLQRIA